MMMSQTDICFTAVVLKPTVDLPIRSDALGSRSRSRLNSLAQSEGRDDTAGESPDSPVSTERDPTSGGISYVPRMFTALMWDKLEAAAGALVRPPQDQVYIV